MKLQIYIYNFAKSPAPIDIFNQYSMKIYIKFDSIINQFKKVKKENESE